MSEAVAAVLPKCVLLVEWDQVAPIFPGLREALPELPVLSFEGGEEASGWPVLPAPALRPAIDALVGAAVDQATGGDSLVRLSSSSVSLLAGLGAAAAMHPRGQSLLQLILTQWIAKALQVSSPPADAVGRVVGAVAVELDAALGELDASASRMAEALRACAPFHLGADGLEESAPAAAFTGPLALDRAGFYATRTTLESMVQGAVDRERAGDSTPADAWFLGRWVTPAVTAKAGALDLLDMTVGARVGRIVSVVPEAVRYLSHHAALFGATEEGARRLQAALEGYLDQARRLLAWDFLRALSSFVMDANVVAERVAIGGRALERGPAYDPSGRGDFLSLRRSAFVVAVEWLGHEDLLDDAVVGGPHASAVQRAVRARAAVAEADRFGGRIEAMYDGRTVVTFGDSVGAFAFAFALRERGEQEQEQEQEQDSSDGFRVGIDFGVGFDVADGERILFEGPVVRGALDLLFETPGFVAERSTVDPLGIRAVHFEHGRFHNEGVCVSEEAWVRLRVDAQHRGVAMWTPRRTVPIAGVEIEATGPYPLKAVLDEGEFVVLVFELPGLRGGALFEVRSLPAELLGAFVERARAVSPSVRTAPIPAGPAASDSADEDEPVFLEVTALDSVVALPVAEALVLPRHQDSSLQSGSEDEVEVESPAAGEVSIPPDPDGRLDFSDMLDEFGSLPPGGGPDAWSGAPLVDLGRLPGDPAAALSGGARAEGTDVNPELAERRKERGDPGSPASPRPLARRPSPSLLGKVEVDLVDRIARSKNGPATGSPAPDFGVVLRDYVIFLVGARGVRGTWVGIGRRYRDVLFDLHRYDIPPGRPDWSEDDAIALFLRAKARTKYAPQSFAHEQVPPGAHSHAVLTPERLLRVFERLGGE